MTIGSVQFQFQDEDLDEEEMQALVDNVVATVDRLFDVDEVVTDVMGDEDLRDEED